MLYISESLVLSQETEFPPWSPVIGWHNLTTADNVSADTEDPLFPASNLATDLTIEQWHAATTAEQRVIVEPIYIGEIDYIGLARHNFGSAQIEVSVEVYTELDINGLPVWEEVHQPIMPANDAVLMFRFVPQAVLGISLRLRSGTSPASAAVLYVGKALIVEPHIQPDFTPLTYGRVTEIANDVNEKGDFLGRTVLSETLESTVSLLYLDPDWYEEEMDPFIAASATTPFFFAWDPLHHPTQVGFAWVKPDTNPQPKIQDVTGAMSIQIEMGAISK